jgi:hypothetical protein
MPVVTLLEKAYGSFPPETFEPFFSSFCKGLRVRLRVVGKTEKGWIQVEVSGDDEIVALRFIGEKSGLAPVTLDGVKRFSVIRGRVILPKKSKKELSVDIGVFYPDPCDAVVPLQRLQTQLFDGKKIPLQRIVEYFCLQGNRPLEVKITNRVNAQNGFVEATLSEEQLSQFSHWIRSCIDRLLVFGALFSDVEYAVKASKLSRDVIRIESLGLLEHAVLCKLGTDAVGLVPKLGRLLSDAVLVPFSPEKIRQQDVFFFEL